jgi:hypothetical protein
MENPEENAYEIIYAPRKCFAVSKAAAREKVKASTMVRAMRRHRTADGRQLFDLEEGVEYEFWPCGVNFALPIGNDKILEFGQYTIEPVQASQASKGLCCIEIATMVLHSPH